MDVRGNPDDRNGSTAQHIVLDREYLMQLGAHGSEMRYEKAARRDKFP